MDYKRSIELYDTFSAIARRDFQHNLFGIDPYNILAPYLTLYTLPWEARYKFTLFTSIKLKIKIVLHLWRLLLKSRAADVGCFDILSLAFSKNQFDSVILPIVKLGSNHSFNIAEFEAPEYDLNGFNSLMTRGSIIDVFICYSKIKKIERDLRSDKFINDVSMSLDGTAIELLIGVLIPAFINELKRMAPFIVAANELYSRLKPSYVLTSDLVDQRCRVFIEKAPSNSKRIFLQQGLFSSEYPEFNYSNCDLYLCYGVKYKQIMVGQGVNANNIVEVGCPAFDAYSSYDISKNSFLLASQPFYNGSFASNEARMQMIQDCIEFFTLNRDFELYIKPHPHEVKSEWDWIRSKYNNIHVIDSQKFNDVLLKHGVLITMYSTVTLDAIFVGMPVINMMYENSILLEGVLDDFPTRKVINKNELFESIDDLSSIAGRLRYSAENSGSRTACIKNHLYSDDRCSAIRAIKYVN